MSDQHSSDNGKNWNRRKFIKSLPLAFGAPYVLLNRSKAKSKSPDSLPHETSVEELLETVPRPVIPMRPDLVKMYDTCWALGLKNSEHDTEGNNFVDWYVDEAFDPRIFQWDVSFSMAWAKYSQGGMPNIESHDNFYRQQTPEGAIGGVIKKSGEFNKPPSSPSFTHNNLFSWAEWEYYLVTGDKSRFDRVIPIIDQYMDWAEKHRRHPNGHYWWSGFGSGMDNSPRSKATEPYPPYGWVDYNANEALAARFLIKMADVAGMEDLVSEYRKFYKEMKQLINEDMWSEDDQIYWDIDKDGSFMKVKTIASFWPLWAKVTEPRHVDGLVMHLNDATSFNRPHRVPTTAADQKSYVPTGGYWRGSIWAPTNHMVTKGLQANDRHQLARDIVLNHLNNMSAVFQGTETVWENYAPEFTKPGSPAKPDFVGWSADGPIAQLIENYIGINVDVPSNKIRWNLLTTEKVGLKNLKFGESTVKLIAEKRDKLHEEIVLKVDTQHTFNLELYDGYSTYQRKVRPGDNKITIKPKQ